MGDRVSGSGGTGPEDPPPPPLVSSTELIQRAQDGDDQALDELCRRYRPRLTQWARGRLPRWARGLLDTEDLVQEAMSKTIRNLPSFESRRDGGLIYYMRRAVTNQ